MEEIINNLNLSKTLQNLFLGKIPILTEYDMFKFYVQESRENAFAHPPFLIPLKYSYDADHYHIGLIKHWFTNRAITFGDMVDGVAFLTSEIAINEEQFYHKS